MTRCIKKAGKSAKNDSQKRVVVIVMSHDEEWMNKIVVYEHRYLMPIQFEPSELLKSYNSKNLQKLAMQINVKLGGINYQVIDVSDGSDSIYGGYLRDNVFEDNDLFIAFNARRLSLPTNIGESYEGSCKDVFSIGYAANCIDGKPMSFLANTVFVKSFKDSQAKRLDYDKILVDILEKVKSSDMLVRRVFLIFTCENAVDPLPLFRGTVNQIKTKLQDSVLHGLPTILLSYSVDKKFRVPEGIDCAFGSVLEAKQFSDRDNSLDVRFVVGTKDDNSGPIVGRVQTINILNSDIGCIDLAQAVFNSIFYRQTDDFVKVPLPAPVFFAMEMTTRSKVLLDQKIDGGKVEGVLSVLNQSFTYGTNEGTKEESPGLSDICFTA
ncbi:hypothetical protein M3Y97_00519100 [Aphelenchoides bicaudatus]|nr:hypothetical protein M3Y97_00519100 [Aphelenchoides bicaudatus]